MALTTLHGRLDADFARLEGHLRSFVTSRATISSASDFSERDECLLEGLLSRVWQAWGAFCRACLCESCLGTVDASGVAVAKIPDAVTEAHVSGAALKAKNSASGPYWGATNTVLRREPTWGDVDVLSTIITRLAPANAGQMSAAFSNGSSSAKALQFIRNAAAHMHHQTLADVQALRSKYVVFPISHPTQALYWVEPKSRDFLVFRALDDLRAAALTAIS